MRKLWAGTLLILGLGLILLNPATGAAQSGNLPGIPPGQTGIDPQEVDRLMKQMLADPESIRMIQELQKDPNMQKILNDPALLDAVNRKDAARLAKDPSIRALQNNKTVKKLMEHNR